MLIIIKYSANTIYVKKTEKNVFFKKYSRQNLIEIHTKTHQVHDLGERCGFLVDKLMLYHTKHVIVQ